MSNNRKWGVVLLVNLSLFLCVIGGLLFFVIRLLDDYTHHGEEILIPNVIGLDAENAEVLLQESGFRCRVIDSVHIDTFPRGMVYEQHPKYNSMAKQDRIIFLTINATEREMVAVPPIERISLRQAESNLIQKGFRIGEVEKVYSNEVEGDGLVLGATCSGVMVLEGTKLPKGTRINLKVSSSTAEFSVPDDSVMEERKE